MLRESVVFVLCVSMFSGCCAKEPARDVAGSLDHEPGESAVRGSVTVSFRGLDQNNLDIHDQYTIRLNDGEAIEFGEGTPAISEGDNDACWDDYSFTFGARDLVRGENTLEITLLPSGVEDKTRDSHLNFDWFRLETSSGEVLADFGTRDNSQDEFDRDTYDPVEPQVALVDLTKDFDPSAFPANLQGPNYGSGENGAARGDDDTGYYLVLRVKFDYAGE
ncbi:MAG: hypothetical protein NUW37_11005 [Planctomycetes bacterium]|nr:hypothetical protein [Planctomycetota bacterium]